jgi:hypothetical protein
MDPKLGKFVLTLSAAGYPLTQLAIRRLGQRGAVISEAACAGLAVRDAAMIAAGVPARLLQWPAFLLYLEFGAAAAASALGLRLAIGKQMAGRGDMPADALEVARRSAVATLFLLHTARFRIYLQPDQGRKPSSV